MECQKLIVDCDAGSDDALALIILIAAHKQRRVEILAITCVAGNTELHNVINNVFRVLHVCDALNVSLKRFPFYNYPCIFYILYIWCLLAKNRRYQFTKERTLLSYRQIITTEPCSRDTMASMVLEMFTWICLTLVDSRMNMLSTHSKV